MSNTVPIPKSTPATNIIKHLRPISLTSVLSKISEEFVVREHLKPAVLEILDPNQFGVIPDSSTSQALVKMIHKWTKATDGNGASVRVILFDYQKAFDYVDHTISFFQNSHFSVSLLPPLTGLPISFVIGNSA